MVETGVIECSGGKCGLYRSSRREAWKRRAGAGWLALTASCASLPDINAFSPQDDVKLGEQAYKEVLADQKILTGGPQVAMVQRVTDRLVAAVKESQPELGNLFPWEVRVIDDPETANAFCLPGGKIAVYTGILPVAKTDAGLAVVLGHEIAHATERHGTKAMTRQVGFEILIEYALNGPVAKDLAGIGSQLAQLQFSRPAELEADHDGLFFLARAGYDPREAVAFWKRMQAKSGGADPSGIELFLSTHPSDEARIAQLEELMPQALEEYQAGAGGPAPEPGKHSVKR
jgi:predicted Zn-dependent protease